MKVITVVSDHELDYVAAPGGDGGSVPEWTPYPCMAFEDPEEAKQWVKSHVNQRGYHPYMKTHQVNYYAKGEKP